VEYRVIISPLYRLLPLRYGYIQQFVDRPTANPTHAYINYTDDIGSLRIYNM
jgi:hypothetical protein